MKPNSKAILTLFVSASLAGAATFHESTELGFQKLFMDPTIKSGDLIRGNAPQSDFDQLQFRTRAPDTDGPAIIQYTFNPRMLTELDPSHKFPYGNAYMNIYENSEKKLWLSWGQESKGPNDHYGYQATFTHFSQSGGDRLRWNFGVYGESYTYSLDWGIEYSTKILQPESLGTLSGPVSRNFTHLYGHNEIFEFRLSSRKSVVIDMAGSSVDHYPTMALFNSNGKSIEVQYDYDEVGNPLPPKITRNLDAGTYYLVTGDSISNFDRDRHGEAAGWDRRGFGTTLYWDAPSMEYSLSFQVAAPTLQESPLKATALSQQQKKKQQRKTFKVNAR